jgi:tetratricopeptide (TPR) repeat protein
MADVFVSYSSRDRERVIPLVEAIQRRGWTAWWDRNIDAGTTFDREIEHAIDEAKCIVVVWSQQSVESDWVRNEATEGLDRGVLVPVTIDAVRPPLAFRRVQTIDLTQSGSGLESMLDAIRRLCPAGAREGRAASPFVGRGTELERISNAIRRAVQGRGGMMLVSGEAGVGKSRLVQEAERVARHEGVLTLTGRCLDTDAAPPYQPLVEQIELALRTAPAEAVRAALGENAPELAKLVPELRQRFPDIASAVSLPPDQERHFLLHGCAEFIDRAARAQPMLLIFEDLHWAGESTCQLLRHLADRLHESPVLVIGTYRDDELESRQPFSKALQDLLRERLVDEIRLSRFGADEVATLLEGRAGHRPPESLVELVYTETEGNPFFVEELYRHLDETHKLFGDDGHFSTDINVSETEVPRGVRLIIERRLEQVSAQCRQLLMPAAVAGRVVDYALLTRVSELEANALFDAIEEAEGSSLLEDVSVGRDVRYQFVHEQIRQTLLSTLSLPRRQRLHLTVADALEAIAGENVALHAADIGYHLYQAGAAADSARTARYLVTGGERAIEAAAFEDALKLLDMALEVFERKTGDDLARLHALRGRALCGIPRIDAALEALSAGLDAAEDRAVEAELLLQRAQLFVHLYRGGDALPDLEHLQTIARERGDLPLELTAQRLVADAHYRLSLDHPEHALPAKEACERTIELARAAHDERALALALIVSGHFTDYWAEYRPQCGRNLAEAREIGERLGDEEIQLDAATMSLRLALFSPIEYELRAEEILQRIERLRDPIRLKEHLFWMIVPTRNAGHLERSVEVCDRAIALADQLGVPPVQYPTFKAIGLAALGRYDEALDSIGQEVTYGSYRFAAALQRYTYVYMHAIFGAVDTMFAELPSLFPECRALNRVWMVQGLADMLTIAGVRTNRHDEATALRNELAADVAPQGLAGCYLEFARGDVDTALAMGQALRDRHLQDNRSLLATDTGEFICACFLAQHRFEAARDEASRHLTFCETSKYRTLQWRLLALRSQARRGLGASGDAEQDRIAAASLLNELAGHIPDADLRRAFLTQPRAVEILREEP